MPPPGQTEVDLTPFWRAWDQIRSEHQRMEGYVAAHEFWASYYHRLRLSSGHIAQNLVDMEENSGWSDTGDPNAASTAFYGRVREGLRSIGAWMMSGLGTAQQKFGSLVQDIDMHYRAVEELLRGPNGLLAQDKVVGERIVPGVEIVTVPDLAKITELDRVAVVVPASSAGHINTLIFEAERRHGQLRDRFREVSAALNELNPEVWRGPTTFAGLTPPGGPGGPATAPGGPAPGGPGGPGTTAAPDAAGPGGPGGAQPGAGSDAPAAPSTSEPGGDQPGADQPGLEEPAADPTAADPTAADPTAADPTAVDPSNADPSNADPTVIDPAIAELPPTDPELAGMPTATATPTSSLPGSSIGPLPSGVPSGLSSTPIGGGPSSTGSPIPLTPVGSAPLPTQFSSPARRDAEPPPTGSSTVDGSRTGAPGAQGESPVPPGGTAGSSSSSGSRTGFGPGFYPPPMIPPMGMGAGRGDVRPGEADFANGPVRQVRGPESWRAGLRPQLLGRAGDRDDERDDCSPPVPAPGDEVLDEELWQVPGAAPPTPPEPQSRRGHSWGP